MAVNDQATQLDTETLPQLRKDLGEAFRSPRLGSLLAIAAAITLGVGLIMSARTPEFVPVMDRLDSSASADVVNVLNSSRYDYKIHPETGAVLVAKQDAAAIRLLLQSSGITNNAEVGLELLQQETSLGTSQFMETARYHHALETELSRTISAMRNIDAARVHLALPKQSVFIRNRSKASASVMIKASAGRSIEPGQVSSVANLVASSIPYLEPSQVTVVDQSGALLSELNANSDTAQSKSQFDYTRKLESLLANRIETLLVPVIGKGNIRTSVTADIDFTFDEQTQEIFEPDPLQIRSEETSSSAEDLGAAGASGVPGALTNQPNALAPIQSQARATQSGSRHATRNYELDKTIRHIKQAPGSIRRLSAAIIVDDKTITTETGESERVKLSDQEIEQITSLAKEAMGFDEARGDSIFVFNQSFLELPKLDAPDPLPIWQQAWVPDLLKQIFTGLAVLLLIFTVARPAMRNLLPAQIKDEILEESEPIEIGLDPQTELSDNQTAAADVDEVHSHIQPTLISGEALELARSMAAQNPEQVARVVREWVEQ